MYSTIKHAYSRVGGFERDAAFERLARSGLEGRALLELAIGEGVSGRTAVVSSFGAESVVLLALVAAIDPGLPVLFLETDRHFPETLRYRDDVIEFLGLRDVRDITPSPAEAATQDPTGDLWWFDPDACCGLRKVRPLAGALSGFDSWITGRKRHQAATRRSLPAVEMDGDLIKINPLVDWDQRMLDDAAREWNLPRHPLVAKGYRSIGCAPCTRAVGSGEDDRAGRWAGSGKTECGIHKAG
jgi:phosphoadenosine phosphosulfate reductase